MDFKQIQSIIRDFEKSNITALDIENEGFIIRLRKNNDPIQPHIIENTNNVEKTNINESKDTRQEDNNLVEVKAPLIGTFYAANNPEEKPFVTIGQKVEKGDTLCIIEAMKIMNEITSPSSGVVKQINVKDGEAVGYDQIIMAIA